MSDLKKLSTARLLVLLKRTRARVLQYWAYNSEDDCSGYKKDMEAVDEIKAVLATREHYPRGKKGRQLRQQAKQCR